MQEKYNKAVNYRRFCPCRYFIACFKKFCKWSLPYHFKLMKARPEKITSFDSCRFNRTRSSNKPLLADSSWAAKIYGSWNKSFERRIQQDKCCNPAWAFKFVCLIRLTPLKSIEHRSIERREFVLKPLLEERWTAKGRTEWWPNQSEPCLALAYSNPKNYVLH